MSPRVCSNLLFAVQGLVDGEIEVEFNYLVESVPITEFIKIIEPPLSLQVLDTGKKLRHRNQVYLFITLNKDSVTSDQWIYFPSKNVPFARISEMKNFSRKMSPAGKTSLFIEFFCFEGDEIWNSSKEELLEMSLPHFEEMGFFTKSDIRQVYQFRKRDVYPLYDVDYKDPLAKLKETLDKFENLFYIGRPGRFRYNNQDHSLEMGMLAAKSIIDGKRYDIDEVGSEKEYYESGKLHKK